MQISVHSDEKSTNIQLFIVFLNVWYVSYESYALNDL